MDIQFLGTSGCVPDAGGESSSFIINRRILVDSGWCNVLKMISYGFDPARLEYLILTHLHQDHYLGLPQLLFYLGLKSSRLSGDERPPFTIIGPSEYLETVVEKAVEFLQISRFPELRIALNVIRLSPGESFDADDFRLETYPAKHFSGKRAREESLACKYTGKKKGGFLVFTGDTVYDPGLTEFAMGATVLIHDSSHTAPGEAASIAKKAGVGRLYLIHYKEERKADIMSEARRIFTNSFPAEEGKRIRVGRKSKPQ